MSIAHDEALARLAALRSAIAQHRTPARSRSSVVCRFWSSGRCTKNKNCTFAHDKPAQSLTSGAVAAPLDEAAIRLRLQALRSVVQKAKGSSSPSTPFISPHVWIRKGITLTRDHSANLRKSPLQRSAKIRAVPRTSFLFNGIPFKLSANGRSLVRISSPSSPPPNAQPKSRSDLANIPERSSGFMPSRLTLNGLEFVKNSSGSLVRSSLTSARQSASARLKRSLKTARSKPPGSLAESDGRKQYCMFFCRFGICKSGASCKFIHDKSKVAVCRGFVNGNCPDPENCLLSHQLDIKKMPVCLHFLKGECSKKDCIYSHVKVNPNSAICQDFLKGYCASGESCRLKHTYLSKRKPRSSSPDRS